MVERGGHLHREPDVPVADPADQHPERDPASSGPPTPPRVIQPSNTGPWAPRTGAVGVAEDRHEVVVGEQAREAERLDPLAGGHQVRPGDRLAPDLEADPDGRIGRGSRSQESGAAGGGRHSVSRRRNLRLPLSRSEPSPNTDSVPTRMTVASALTSGVTPNLIWVMMNSGSVELRPDREERDDELVDREGHAEERAGDDRGRDERQDDVAERLPAVRPEVGGGPLEPPVESLQPGGHDEHDERRREHQVAQDHRVQAEPDPEQREEDEQAEPDEDARDHDRQGEQDPGGPREADAAPHEREGGHRPDERRQQRHDDGDEHGVEQGRVDRAVREHLLVPVGRQPGDREARRVGHLEREQDEEHDRQVEEDQGRAGQEAETATGLPGQRADRHRVEGADPLSHGSPRPRPAATDGRR